MSCCGASRAACADAPALTQVSTHWRARLRVSARGHACTRTRSRTDARFAKLGCSQKNGRALCEYEGRVQNRYRLTPKTGPVFFAFLLFAWRCFANSCACVSASWRCVTTSTFGSRLVSNADLSSRIRNWESESYLILIFRREFEFGNQRRI